MQAIDTHMNESDLFSRPHIGDLVPELIGHCFSFLCEEDEWNAVLSCRLWTFASLSFSREDPGKLIAHYCSRGNLAAAQYVDSLTKKWVNRRHTAFLGACRNGHLAVVVWLVSQGVDVRAYNDRPLCNACLNGHLEVAKWLVSQGDDVRAYNDKPLCNACLNGHLAIVKWLVTQGADVHANNDNALYIARSRNHTAVIQWLINYTEDI